MSRIQNAWDSIPVEGDFVLITADEVRRLSGCEPRLMMKFDHSHLLPAKLRDHGRFILPLRNGLYAILAGTGYHHPEICPEPVDFPRQTQFRLNTTETGISEMQHLDMAFNSGLLAEFLEEPLLYPTIRGRKRSPQFHFRCGDQELDVQGVQVEIDGGFEGRNSVTVVEAKIGECHDFHLRQLYYPFRFWSTQTQKTIRPVFFTFDPATNIYRLREYAFDPPDIYCCPRLVKAAAYRIVEPVSPRLEPLIIRTTTPVPQADRIEKVAVIPFLVDEGYDTPNKLAPLLEFSPRQGRYYLDAAGSLGLLERNYRLTTLGLEYLSSTPDIRHQILAKAILSLPIAQEILAYLVMAPSRTLHKDFLVELTRCSTGLAPATARRRTQTLWNWLAWVTHHSGALRIVGNELRLEPHLNQAPGAWTQLSLFESKR